VAQQGAALSECGAFLFAVSEHRFFCITPGSEILIYAQADSYF
jgi:hypothetical protein